MNADRLSTRPTESVDAAEIRKFDALAGRFWDPAGEFGPLHRLNPVRLRYVNARASLRIPPPQPTSSTSASLSGARAAT